MALEYLLIPPLAAFVLFGLQWLLWGRHASQGKDTVMVNTDPPDDLSVIECGVLYDDVLNDSDISLELLNLHLKGIVEISPDGAFVLKIEENSPQYAALTAGETMMVRLLFEGFGKKMYLNRQSYEAGTIPAEAKPRTDLSAELFKIYRERLARKIADLKIDIYDSLTEKGYFTVSPYEQRKPYYAIAGLIMAVPALLNIGALIDGHATLLPWSLVAGLILASIIIAFIGSYMARETVKGSEKRAYILGFRQYVQTAEADLIRFVLQNNIDAYKKILPFAGLFNSFEKWSKPLKSFEQGIVAADIIAIKDTIDALDVESGITNRKKWPQALLSLFLYGIKLIPTTNTRNNWWNDDSY